MNRASKPVVIITGVSGGIGQHSAQLFASKGWIVVGSARGRTRPAGLRGLQIDLQIADMLKPRDLERLVQTAWKTYGRIDALVCNAGYGLIGPLDTFEYAQMDEQLKVNTLAPAELARQVVPLMRRQKSGVIIGISSIAGRAGFSGYGLYAASKFGLEGLFEALAMELAAFGVRVKLIEPSGVNTAFWDNLKRGNGRGWSNQELGLATEGTMGANANRGLSPDKVAQVILRAAGDRSSRLRYPVGQTATVSLARRFLPERWFDRILRKIVTGN